MRGFIALAALAAAAAAGVAATPFVFGERAGKTHLAGEAHWRDALLRASVGGCKERLPRGSRLRARIRDCVVNQVHVTNLSPHPLECQVVLEFPAADDDGRTRIELTIHVDAYQERWTATAYGPSSLEPSSFGARCARISA